MTVSENKKRIAITVSKEVYEKLKKMASSEQRTISNLASYLINQQLKNK